MTKYLTKDFIKKIRQPFNEIKIKPKPNQQLPYGNNTAGQLAVLPLGEQTVFALQFNESHGVINGTSW